MKNVWSEQGKGMIIDTFQEENSAIKGSIKIDEDIVEKFKKIIIDMHRGIPQFYYYGYLEKLIPNKEIRDYFFKTGVFVKSNSKEKNKQDRYFLGVNGIILANNYKSEELSKTIKRLTWFMAVLTFINLVASIILIIK